jgi:hypothetical protein
VINRITLDETSWVEYVTGWLPGPDADELLAKLTANAAWEQRERRMVNRVVIEPASPRARHCCIKRSHDNPAGRFIVCPLSVTARQAVRPLPRPSARRSVNADRKIYGLMIT